MGRGQRQDPSRDVRPEVSRQILIPLDTRNKLYAIFVASLLDPKAVSGFDELTADPEYLNDRIPRYRAVLREYKGGGPLALFELLFDHGLFFDAHEYLETPWKAAEGQEKLRLQGLIQIAAGLHKLELNPKGLAGSRELLRKGLEKLKAADPAAAARYARRVESPA